MSQPTTTYKGKTIYFHESTETWKCDELGIALSALSDVKKKIDGYGKKERTLNLPAIYVEERYRNDEYVMKDVTVTLVLENGRSARVIDTGKRKGSYQVDLHSLYPVDRRPLLQKWMELRKAWKEATNAMESAQTDCTAFDAATIREAVIKQAEEAA